MISFVVPAYNEEKLLGVTLQSIHAAARATGEPYEVIVSDDGSTDATAAVAEANGAKVVAVAHRQISKTRNSGARASMGEHLIFVDADTTVDEAVVRAALDAMKGGAIGGGAAVRFNDGPRWVNAVVGLLVPVFRLAKWAAGCFVFCTREGFDKAGGFPEEYFAAEEIWFSQALKRHGRFVVVHAKVTTSARKASGRSVWGMAWLMVKLVARSPLGVKKREHADFWYDGKR